MKKKREVTCLRCGKSWKPNVDKPKYCPFCKQPRWGSPARVKGEKKAHGLTETQDEVFDRLAKR